MKEVKLDNFNPWVNWAINHYYDARSKDIPVLASLLAVWQFKYGTDEERRYFLQIYYAGLSCDKGVQVRSKIAYSAEELDRFVEIRAQSQHWNSTLSKPPITRWRGRAAS